MSSVAESAARLLFNVRDRLKANKYVRRVYYNVKNAQQFSGLLEHDIMLADQVRIGSYRRAIERYVKEGDVVVDLGTGSGILSFFASAQRPRKIYAIDHSNVIAKAQAVAVDNAPNNITFMRVNSRKFKLPEGRADVIIHEQIGDLLLNENMVANLIDLRDRILTPGGKIVPSRFDLFVEPVQMKEAYRVPFIWEQRIEGVDFRAMRAYADKLPRDYFHASIRSSDVDRLLGSPEPIMSFDLETMALDDLPKRVRYQRRVTHPGRLDGFVLYFSVIFDDDIRFDTAPGSPETHWGMTILRTEACVVNEGDTIRLDLTIDDVTEITTWRWTSGVARA